MTIWDEASKQERDEISRLSLEHGSPAGAAITLLRRLERRSKDADTLHAVIDRLDAQNAELLADSNECRSRLGELSKFTIHKAGCRSLQWNKCSCGLQELVVERQESKS